MAEKKPTHVVIRAHYSRVNGALKELPVGQTFTFSKEQAAKLNPKFFAEYDEKESIDAAGGPATPATPAGPAGPATPAGGPATPAGPAGGAPNTGAPGPKAATPPGGAGTAK